MGQTAASRVDERPLSGAILLLLLPVLLLVSVALELIERRHLVEHDGRTEAPQQLAVELETDRLHQGGSWVDFLDNPTAALRRLTTALGACLLFRS